MERTINYGRLESNRAPFIPPHAHCVPVVKALTGQSLREITAVAGLVLSPGALGRRQFLGV